MVNGEPASVYCQEWEPTNSWYRQGSSATAIFEIGGGIVFTYRGSWCADGLAHQLGERLADRRRARHARLGRLRRVARRSRRGRCARASSTEPSRSPCRRSIRSDRVGGHLGVIQDFVARRRERRPSRRRAAPTTSRAWPWSFGAIESAETGRRVDNRDLRKDDDAEPASRHPHRHHGAGQPRRPGRLCQGRSCRSASRASSRSSGRRSAARTSRASPARSARRSATPTSSSARSACSAIRSRSSDIDRGDARRLGNADRQRASVRHRHRQRLHRPHPRQAADRQPAALQGGVGPARQARRRQGREHRLRELRDGRQLGERRLEHRPQSRRLGADVQRAAGRQSRARMGALPPARLPDRSDPADPQMGAEGSSTSTARTRRCAGT